MSGQQVGTVVGGVIGAVVGFYAGGNVALGWQIGAAAGGAIGGYVDPDVIKGPKLTDPQKQTSAEGVPRPIVYGTAAVFGNVIQCQSVPTQHKHKKRTGKGGGPVQQTYTYTRTAAIRICEAAPLGGEMMLRRVWMNGKLALDRTGTGDIDAESAKLLGEITFYPGSETQLPDPDLEALPAGDGGGVGNVPAYRGSCYVVLRNVDVTNGGALPQFMWEVTSAATETEDQNCAPLWLINSNGSIRRTDDPVDWTQTAASGSDTDYLFSYEDRLVACSGGQAKYSDDNGVTWATLPNWPVSGDHPPPVVLPNGRILVLDAHSTSAAVYYSDAGTEGPWTPVSVGGGGSYIAGGVASVIVCENSLSGQYFISNDGGDSFGAGIDLPGVVYALGYKNGTFMFGMFAGYPYWSTDGGVTLNLASGTGAPDAPRSIFGTSSGAWLAATSGSGTNVIYRSANGSTGWAPVTHPDIYYNSGESQLFAEYEGVVITAGPKLDGTEGPVILYSEDGGATWAKATHAYGVSGTSAYGVFVKGFIPPEGSIEVPDSPGFYLTADGELVGCQPGTITPSAVYLGDIVADQCDRSGVSDCDVSAIASIEVRGFPVTTPVDAAGCIQALQQVYPFSFPEWGNSGDTSTKLRAVLLGGPAVATITDDDLLETDDEETVRRQQVEFPRKVTLFAPDPDANYEATPQSAERESENVKATGEVSISTAVVLSRGEKAQVVDIAHKVLWEEANGTAKFELPEEFTRLVPSDPVIYDGRRYRINRVELGDGMVTVEGVRDRASAYTSNATANDTVALPPTQSGLRGPTMMHAMNLPSLRTSDNVPGMYVGVCGRLPGWVGCDLYLSVDGGVSEQLVATIIDPATMGYLTAPVTATGEPISIRLYNDDELDSVTLDQLAARMNAAAITTDEVSEILQFQTPTDTGDKAYDLADLSRGLLGTDAAEHFSQDPIVILDGSEVFLPIDISHAGKTLIFRPVSRGTIPENNATYSFLYSPVFTSVTISAITVGGDPITVSGQPIYVVT